MAVKALYILLSAVFSAEFNNFSRLSDFISCPYIGCPKKLLLLLTVIHGLFGDTKIIHLGLTPAIGVSPNFSIAQKSLADSNT